MAEAFGIIYTSIKMFKSEIKAQFCIILMHDFTLNQYAVSMVFVIGWGMIVGLDENRCDVL